MKKWRFGFRKVIVFVMTAVLLAGTAGSCKTLPVQAEEAETAEGTAGNSNTDEKDNADEAAELESNEPEDNTEKSATQSDTNTDDTAKNSAAKDIAKSGTSLEEGGVKNNLEEETVFVTEEFSDLPDNDELLMGYIDQLFYGDMNAGISTYGNVGGTRLTDANEIKMYNELKTAIQQIAAGKRSSTTIEINNLSVSLETWEEGEFDRRVVEYLLMDCPYEFYWFDKTKGWKTSGSRISTSPNYNTITFSFSVAEEYCKNTNVEYTADTSKTVAATNAVENARTIVSNYSAKSDRDKLNSYCQEICDLVSYNNAAVINKPPYGNPWQLIWVFDNNPETQVVCEGYSKAFQYLCDLSSFKNNTVCYTVTGVMESNGNSGPHMWNIVTLEEKNYLVDVTNSDTGAVGQDKSLFLAAPKSGTVDTTYTFFNNSNQSITYTYDSDQMPLFGKKILSLSAPGEPAYDDPISGSGTNQGSGTNPGTGNEPKPNTGTGTTTNPQPTTSKPAAPASKTVTLSLNGQNLKNNTTLKATFGKKYSFKAVVIDTAGKLLTSGNGKITWSTSNKNIATVTSKGIVSVKKKAGTVTITAKTADGKTAKVKLKVSKAAVKVTKVKLTGSKAMNLKTKKTQTLKATVTPASAANQKVTWKSSNKKIATVNSKGKVTAKKAGTVTITATAKDGSKKKATIKIKIKKK